MLLKLKMLENVPFWSPRCLISTSCRLRAGKDTPFPYPHPPRGQPEKPHTTIPPHSCSPERSPSRRPLPGLCWPVLAAVPAPRASRGLRSRTPAARLLGPPGARNESRSALGPAPCSCLKAFALAVPSAWEALPPPFRPSWLTPHDFQVFLSKATFLSGAVSGNPT